MLPGNISGGPRRQIKEEDFAFTKYEKMEKMLESELIMNISIFLWHPVLVYLSKRLVLKLFLMLKKGVQSMLLHDNLRLVGKQNGISVEGYT